MTTTGSVDLVSEPSFALGQVLCDPAIREIRQGGKVIVLEPRIMQVLVVLAHQPGQTVGRQTLIDRCWDGRIVGDDAINRAILKLRRAASDLGGGFRIDTVARVGYRLIVCDGADLRLHPSQTGRRVLLIGAGAATILSCIGLAGYRRLSHDDTRLGQARALYARGEAAFEQGSPDDNAQALGFFQQAATLAPDDADIQGALALACRFEQAFQPPRLIPQSTARADRATARALALDPHNPDAIAARSMFVPFRQHWQQTEQGLRQGLREVPGSGVMNGFLGMVLAAVGRTDEALTRYDRAILDARFVPLLREHRLHALFAAGRLGDADAELDASAALFPRFVGLWWIRFWIYAYSGRTEQAARLLASPTALPNEVTPALTSAAHLALSAIEDRNDSVIDLALAAWQTQSQTARPLWPGTIGLAASLGRHDAAFQFAANYLAPFDRPAGQRLPSTAFLFGEPLAPLRRDPRLGIIMRRVGLAEYWGRTGTHPDARIAAL